MNTNKELKILNQFVKNVNICKIILFAITGCKYNICKICNKIETMTWIENKNSNQDCSDKTKHTLKIDL